MFLSFVANPYCPLIIGSRRSKKARSSATALFFIFLIVPILVACATPIRVERLGERAARRDLMRGALANHTPSINTQNVLSALDLAEMYDRKPEEALKVLHQRIQTEGA